MNHEQRASQPATAVCKHCGMGINGSLHVEGVQRGLSRCGPEGGLPYGYNAEPVGAECGPPCLGMIISETQPGH